MQCSASWIRFAPVMATRMGADLAPLLLPNKALTFRLWRACACLEAVIRGIASPLKAEARSDGPPNPE